MVGSKIFIMHIAINFIYLLLFFLVYVVTALKGSQEDAHKDCKLLSFLFSTFYAVFMESWEGI